MRALIIGGAGLLGTHLAPRLELAGFETFRVDNFSGSLVARTGTGPKVFTADVSNRNALSYVFEKSRPDIVVVAAGFHYGKDVRYNPFDEAHSVLNIANTVASLVSHKVKKLFYCSHSDVYGGPDSSRISEDRRITMPSSYRGSAYLAAEKLLAVRCAETGTELSILRLFDMVGPRISFAPITCRLSFIVDSLLRQEQIGLSGADKKRDFIHVDDVVSAIIGLQEVGFSGIVNIGSGAGVSLNKLVKELEKSLRITYHPVDVPDRTLTSFHSVADTSRLEEAVSWWSPKVDVLGYLPDFVEFRRKEHLYYSPQNRAKVLEDQRRGT